MLDDVVGEPTAADGTPHDLGACPSSTATTATGAGSIDVDGAPHDTTNHGQQKAHTASRKRAKVPTMSTSMIGSHVVAKLRHGLLRFELHDAAGSSVRSRDFGLRPSVEKLHIDDCAPFFVETV